MVPPPLLIKAWRWILGKPFARITMVDAVKKYAGVDFDQIHTLEEARAVAKEKGVEFEGRHKKGDILNLFFEGSCRREHLVPAYLCSGPSGGDFTSDQEKAGQSRLRGAL